MIIAETANASAISSKCVPLTLVAEENSRNNLYFVLPSGNPLPVSLYYLEYMCFDMETKPHFKMFFPFKINLKDQHVEWSPSNKYNF